MSGNGVSNGKAPWSPRLTASARGFSLLEVLLGMVVLVVALLGFISMFSSGYSNVAESGSMTMGFSAAQQLLEDVRAVPFANLPNLNNFSTDNAGSQPAGGPERDIARKWRYALAGDGAGWGFTAPEKQRWTVIATGERVFGGTGQITVTDTTPLLRTVSVTVTMPDRAAPIRLNTVVGRF
jgi:prepilin-type N-terminal cleavage/methylation domain-containing protein